jgi:hypothetical protein
MRHFKFQVEMRGLLCVVLGGRLQSGIASSQSLIAMTRFFWGDGQEDGPDGGEMGVEKLPTYAEYI